MRLEVFCLNRPHYPYECTEQDLVHLGMQVRGMLINEPVITDGKLAYIDVVVKPLEPVPYILATVTLKSDEVGVEKSNLAKFF